MSAHPDSVTTQSQPGQVEPAPASVTDEGDDDAAAATGVDVSSDEDSLSRAPTLPFGPSAVTPGHTQPHEAVFGEPSRPSAVRSPLLPPRAVPPRGAIGSERLRQGELEAYAAQARVALTSQAEESPLHSAEAVADREAAAAALAAAMEVDARNNKMPPPPTAPNTGSPTKKTKHASQAGPLQPSPMFGGQVIKAGDVAAKTEQDRTRASARGGGVGLVNPGTGTGRNGPVHHHIGEGDPPWLAGLRQTLLGDMQDMKEGQREILTTVQQQCEEFRSMGRRLETVEERQGEMLAFRDDMERRMRDMQNELREVRSRSVSPAPTPRNAGPRAGTGQAPSPAASSNAPYVVDDFQLVLGGYTDAKREEIQNEVRGLFEAAHALPLLRNIITPYVRSNICRIELLYLDEGLSARRKVQQSVIVGLRAQLEARNKKSQIAGQERAALWVSRNRGVEERNRLRALLGLRDFGLRFLPPGDVDFDWKGRVWFRNCQVLFHCDREEPSPHALMFLSARGDETGWWTSTPTISRILGMSESQVRTELQG